MKMSLFLFLTLIEIESLGMEVVEGMEKEKWKLMMKIFSVEIELVMGLD